MTDVPQARPPATPRTTTLPELARAATGDPGLAHPSANPPAIIDRDRRRRGQRTTRTADISTYLRQYPGSQYLRTDVSCGSLRDRDDYGNVIYAVHRVAGRSRSDICSLRAELSALAAQLGNDAPYGKWLDNTTDPSTFISPPIAGQ